MNQVIIRLIKSYQKKGGGENLLVDCNFYPSCSNYALEVFKKYSFFKASKLTFKRIKKCNKKDLIHKITDLP